MIANFRFPVARACVRGGKLPLFGEPRTRRRFSEKYHAVSEKSLLDAGIIRRGRWAFIVFPLPKPDGALVESVTRMIHVLDHDSVECAARAEG
jgi:hypothetical protein